MHTPTRAWKNTQAHCVCACLCWFCFVHVLLQGGFIPQNMGSHGLPMVSSLLPSRLSVGQAGAGWQRGQPTGKSWTAAWWDEAFPTLSPLWGSAGSQMLEPVMDALRWRQWDRQPERGKQPGHVWNRTAAATNLSLGSGWEGIISQALNQCQSEQGRLGATSAPLRRGWQSRRSSFCALPAPVCDIWGPLVALLSRNWRTLLCIFF